MHNVRDSAEALPVMSNLVGDPCGEYWKSHFLQNILIFLFLFFILLGFCMWTSLFNSDIGFFSQVGYSFTVIVFVKDIWPSMTNSQTFGRGRLWAKISQNLAEFMLSSILTRTSEPLGNKAQRINDPPPYFTLCLGDFPSMQYFCAKQVCGAKMFLWSHLTTSRDFSGISDDGW